MMTILEGLRARAIAWIRNATITQLGTLPSEILGFSADTTTKVVLSKSNNRRPRILKKMRRRMTRVDGDIIRKAFEGLTPRSPAWTKKREELCREHGFSRRQIASAATGLIRSKTRKASMGTKKK